MKSVIAGSCALLLALLVSGCSLTARRLEVSAMRGIQVGRTTRAEVEKVFGPAHDATTNAQGQVLSRYFFRQYVPSTDASLYERKDHPGDVLFRTLTLLFGPDQALLRKLHDESLTPVEQYNGWYVSGPELTPAQAQVIRPKHTTGAELIQRLGQPASRSFQADGLLEWNWIRVKVRPGRLPDPEVRRFSVRLDDREVVQESTLHQSDFPGVLGPFGR